MSIQDVDVDAGQGGDAGDSSSQEKERAGFLAELARRDRKAHGLETQLAELKGTVDTLKQTQQQPKEHTRAELQTAVDAGQISQVDADRLLEERSEKRITDRIQSGMQQTARAGKITAEIARYKELKPEIMEDGSSTRQAVADAYDYQINVLGKPATTETELDALMSVLGPASKLQNGRTKELETHQETGGGDGEQSTETEGWPKDMPARHRRHYESQINKGVLTKEAAKKQWAYQPKHAPR